ncbi:MAG: aminopeptidase, partial [Lachnospiraceae bacterium]|nr:aminopeptidase [Lachnospiraceae bacterium]
MERKNAWKTYDDNALKELDKLSTGYREFLDNGQTERECVKQIIKAAEGFGYVNLLDAIKKGNTLKAGDKIYNICMDKTVAIFNIG